MAWKNISTSTYKGLFECSAAAAVASGNVWVALQYDDESISPTSVKLRWVLSSEDNNNYFDKFYLLIGQSASGTLIKIKDVYTKSNKSAWPYYSASFTLTKAYNASGFIIPKYYIINNGYDAYKITNASTAYTAATTPGSQDGRKSWTAAIDSKTISIVASTTVAGVVGTGTISIKDNYNNTFTITGTKGAAGANNPSTGPTISWGYSTSYGSTGAVTNKALTIATPANATRTVYAKSVTGAKYGSDTVATTSLAIRQYVAPSSPGVPVLSYKKSRLTIKEPWTFLWTPASATNTSSPIKGYRIRLYKNGSLVKGLTAGSGSSITLSGTNEWLDRESSSCAITLDPVAFGFKAGDTIQLGIFAYTRNGSSNTGTQIFSGSGSTQIMSATYTVQNAGVVHSKVGGAWKEGQVYIKVAGIWKEAESVNIKAGGVWKESQ